MKQMTLIEMDGFLKGKCIPSDLKVDETNAEYLVRKFGELESKLETALRECRSAGITIDNLEAKCAKMAADNKKAMEAMRQADAAVKLAHEKFSALAAENARLKSAHPQPFGPEMMKALDAYEKYQDEVPETGMLNAFFILRDSIRVDTPATDAFLAEVRAQGVDMARNAMIDFVDGEVGPNKNIPGLIRGAEICVSIAEQLRKGVRP
ncbi:hypothetical protein EFK65_10015 [Escherichia coli]|uniref:hypothetical protein n=1 Tax=Escherichia coli TaxID=562 RepID=UPI001F499582|nr:hypothetical protein [Escherichia coli]MCH7083140.1 hypothetical protein [Escherichia coli]